MCTTKKLWDVVQTLSQWTRWKAETDSTKQIFQFLTARISWKVGGIKRIDWKTQQRSSLKQGLFQRPKKMPKITWPNSVANLRIQRWCINTTDTLLKVTSIVRSALE